jgi:hypothetical protein
MSVAAWVVGAARLRIRSWLGWFEAAKSNLGAAYFLGQLQFLALSDGGRVDIGRRRKEQISLFSNPFTKGRMKKR